MRKALAIAVALFATSALAGDYHKYTTLVCSDCHTMHASRTHSWGQTGRNTADTFVFGTPSNGHETLLLEATQNETCLVCHDGGRGAPDVFATNNSTTYGQNGRPAGALNSGETGIPNVDGYDTYMGHSLGSTLAPPGYNGVASAGAAWTGDLECSRCHSVHGSGAYRNLGDRTWAAAFKPSYAVSTTGTLDTTVDVNVLASGAAGYDAANVFYTMATGSTATTTGIAGIDPQFKMNNLCGGCHGNFHQDTGVIASGNAYFQRHPTQQVRFTSGGLISSTPVTHGGYRNLLDPTATTLKLIFVTAGTGWTQTLGAVNVPGDAQLTLGCTTCHKGHGTKRSYGLFIPASNTTGSTGTLVHNADTDLENGSAPLTATVRQLCIQCHSMGRSNATMVK